MITMTTAQLVTVSIVVFFVGYIIGGVIWNKFLHGEFKL